MKTIWKILLPSLIVALLAWGAWDTLTTANAVPRQEFEQHKDKNSDQFMKMLNEIKEQREKIEEKLDKIQEKL